MKTTSEPEHAITDRKRGGGLLLIILCSFALVVFTNLFAVQYSEISYGMFKFALGIGLFALFDKYIMKGIYTIHELKKGNTAYAIFMFAFAYLLASAFRMF